MAERGKPVSLVALWCSYRGAGFHGYQAQGTLRTVQAELLRAFSSVGLPRNPVVAGRTDRGVSARMQVLSSRVHTGTSLDEMRDALNAALPDDIRIERIKPAKDKFHAAWSATGKVYRYQLGDDVSLEALEQVRAFAPSFVGTRTFKPFHFKTSEARKRTIEAVTLTGRTLEFRGDAFARHMVRMLTGALLAVARGRVSREVFTAALEEDRFFHCPVAEPEPLTLWEVLYPADVDPFTATERAENAPPLPRGRGSG
ncbi:MAG: tRNA pseudouridine(38-40) synthase TruA [Archangium sp.]